MLAMIVAALPFPIQLASFARNDIQSPVKPIFNTPMSTYGIRERLGNHRLS
jgi:hypothetical protein